MEINGGAMDEDVVATALGALKLYSEEEMDSVFSFPDHFDGAHLTAGMIGVAGTLFKLLPPKALATLGPSLRSVRVRRRLRKELATALTLAEMVSLGETVNFSKYAGKLSPERWDAFIMIGHTAVLATAVVHGRNDRDLIMDFQREWLT